LQQLLGEEAFPGWNAEVKIEQFEQAPLDACADVCENLMVGIFAILGKDVPWTSDDLPALGLAGVVLQLLQNFLENAEVQHSHFAVVFGDDAIGEAVLDGGLGEAIAVLDVLLRQHILDRWDALQGGLFLLAAQVEEGDHLVGGVWLLRVGDLPQNG
jgi:hypothetical protein